MSKIKVLVWHTPIGKIVAVGQPTSQFEITFIGDDNQAVLVAEVDEELVQDLHRTHVVDVENKTLIRCP
jgi:hypothetical protein